MCLKECICLWEGEEENFTKSKKVKKWRQATTQYFFCTGLFSVSERCIFCISEVYFQVKRSLKQKMVPSPTKIMMVFTTRREWNGCYGLSTSIQINYYLLSNDVQWGFYCVNSWWRSLSMNTSETTSYRYIEWCSSKSKSLCKPLHYDKLLKNARAAKNG